MKFVITLLTVVFSSLAYGQAMDSETLEAKTNLEKKIKETYENIISTQLKPGTFNVGVSLNLKKIKEKPPVPPSDNKSDKKEDEKEAAAENQAQTSPKKNPDDLKTPLGIDLGYLDVDKLIANYEEQIRVLKETQKLAMQEFAKMLPSPQNPNGGAGPQMSTERPARFTLESAEVSVGLSNLYDESYKAEFADWLKTRIDKDFKNKGSSQVTTYTDPTKEVEKVEKDFKNTSWYQKFEDFQIIWAAAIMGLMGLVLLVIFKVLMGGDFKNQTLNGTVSQSGKLQMEDGESEAGTAANPLSAMNEESPEQAVSLHKMLLKVGSICMDLPAESLKSLFQIWMDGGNAGFLKAAMAIDAILTESTRIVEATGTKPLLHLNLMDFNSDNQEQIKVAYQEVREKLTKEKFEILESAYWDLVSIKTLGVHSLRTPFDYLNTVPEESLNSILKEQDLQTRSLALLYSQNKTRSTILKSLDEDQKLDVLQNILKTPQIADKEVWDIDTSFKMIAIHKNSQSETIKKINLMPRTISFLEDLGPVEEINMLRKTAATLPEGGKSIKQEFLTLAFLEEWDDSALKEMAKLGSPDELLSLIYTIPNVRNLLLGFVPPKMKAILEDDLSKPQQKPSLQTMNEKLRTLRDKVAEQLEKQSQSPASLYRNLKEEGLSNAA